MRRRYPEGGYHQGEGLLLIRLRGCPRCEEEAQGAMARARRRRRKGKPYRAMLRRTRLREQTWRADNGSPIVDHEARRRRTQDILR